ncbi:hypothetical protein LM6186_170111 [Listeria monocytogenes]|nr:hypothetical protein LM500065_180053 [Listeria monocytogenes]CUK65330.1 hypothetical protein LM601244_100108 [Listeria monocytogenes]CUK70887.1 hypothetical protein LM600727_90106 [Listeria monocytogenes]CUK73660.1 hypothetical protein LM600983_230103 [Listeria monocytogenes]CUK81832.1 hypothetical protein LM6186_170111 [Listeria monocytogenes]
MKDIHKKVYIFDKKCGYLQLLNISYTPP